MCLENEHEEDLIEEEQPYMMFSSSDNLFHCFLGISIVYLCKQQCCACQNLAWKENFRKSFAPIEKIFNLYTYTLQHAWVS